MMGPIAAVRSVLVNSFNFSGRAQRSEFWWWALVQPILMIGFIWFDVLRLRGMDVEMLANVSPDASALYMMMITPWVSLLLIIPNLSVSIRRLHDIGKSGLWYLLIFVPLIGPLVLLVFWVLPSENTPNSWGPPPGNIAEKNDPIRYAQESAAMAGLPQQTAMGREDITDFYRKRVLGEA